MWRSNLQTHIVYIPEFELGISGYETCFQPLSHCACFPLGTSTGLLVIDRLVTVKSHTFLGPFGGHDDFANRSVAILRRLTEPSVTKSSRPPHGPQKGMTWWLSHSQTRILRRNSENSRKSQNFGIYGFQNFEKIDLMISINRLNRLNRKKSQNRLNRFFGHRINSSGTAVGI